MIQTMPCQPKDIKIVLLLGGNSGEREISLISGKASAQALRGQGFEVVEVDTADADYRQQICDANPSVVFICLHGRGGEDGQIQQELEDLGYKYTGSGVSASATAMDKGLAKEVYFDAGIPTPDVVYITSEDESPLERILETIGLDSAVKPANEGSALGVHLVHDEEALQAALEDALSLDRSVLVERIVEGVEVTVAVLGNENPEALPIIEIVPHSDFYDFEAKYEPGGSSHIIPARISQVAAERCASYALLAHKALGCRGVSRTDMIVDDQDQPWVLETNTIPGMTETSLLPDAAKNVGLDFGALCKLLVELALED